MLALVESGVPLLTMQVQYSLLDNRAARRMAEAAAKNGVSLLCYGTVAGGFLGDRWLGVPEPASRLREPLAHQIQAGHRRFRRLGRFSRSFSQTLRRIADRHASDIATVASAAMLRRPAVAAVIVGARNRSHLASNLAISDLALTDADHAEIAAVLSRASELDGDVFELERDRNGRHGAIMKYNLNKGAA